MELQETGIWSLPKDLLRWFVNRYVQETDYPALLAAHRMFHILPEKERTEKYKTLVCKGQGPL